MTDTEQNAVPSEPSASPREAFRLSGDIPKVARLSRKSLAAIGVVTGVAIGGALLVALRPPDRKMSQEIYGTDSRAKADSLTSAPKDYSQVPILGKPLPGDLGKPILSAQQSERGIAVAQLGFSDASARNGTDKDRDKGREELAAARASQLFLGGTSNQPAVPVDAAAPVQIPALMAPNLSDTAQSDADRQGSTAARLSFLEQERDQRSNASAPIENLPSPNILQAGSMIPAALITGIRSDLPGQISAQVTQNVHDSPTGRILLIPQGSRLIGEYDAAIDAGQTRVLMAWTRLILPDGRSIPLERQPGADMAGFSGVEDKVDNHWANVARAALLSTLMGIGTELAAGSDADLVRAIRRGSQDSVNQAGQQVVQRELSVRPTLTIRPGFPVRIMVTHDLILPAWRKE